MASHRHHSSLLSHSLSLSLVCIDPPFFAMNLMFLFVYLLALPVASAHYFFSHFIANGNFTGWFEYVRDNSQGYMPMKAGYDSNDFRCRTDSQRFAADSGVYKVKAGDEIGLGTAFYTTLGHPGPLQIYMSKAPGDVREYDGSGDWFKVYELGPTAFSSEGIQWGASGVGNFTFKLPNETPAGQYLVRIEHIGLHGAGEYGGAEFYYNCAQIEVEGDSTAVPGPLVKIPGVYNGSEPGILFYMYRPWIVNYIMPGPPTWPKAYGSNITARGVSVAPTESQWTLPAVTPGFVGESVSPPAPEHTSQPVVDGLTATTHQQTESDTDIRQEDLMSTLASEMEITAINTAVIESSALASSVGTQKSRCRPKTVYETVTVFGN